MSFTLKVPGKKYGLVKPTKKRAAISAFGGGGGGDDSDDDDGEMSVNQQIQAAAQAKMRQKKVQAEHQAALDEDATVFDYDGVYDAMQEKRQQSAASRKKVELDRKPKYIEKIMKMADFKKREEERVKERVEAKARLKELEEFGETEKFVTNAYKKKLLEWQTLDAEDARQAAVESMNDPAKKGSLDNFYMNLMHNNVSMGNMVDKPAADGAAAAGGGGAAADGGAGGTAGGGADGDGLDLGIAGGSQMHFDMSQRGTEDEEAVRRRSRPQRSNGAAEKQARQAKEKEAKAAQEARRVERRNGEEAVQSARERYLARKKAKTEEGAS
eukprot:SAG22_NODE_921_length_6492_cov_5.072423_3_plen_327_part_00